MEDSNETPVELSLSEGEKKLQAAALVRFKELHCNDSSELVRDVYLHSTFIWPVVSDMAMGGYFSFVFNLTNIGMCPRMGLIAQECKHIFIQTVCML
jgi:hypothetical protein